MALKFVAHQELPALTYAFELATDSGSGTLQLGMKKSSITLCSLPTYVPSATYIVFPFYPRFHIPNHDNSFHRGCIISKIPLNYKQTTTFRIRIYALVENVEIMNFNMLVISRPCCKLPRFPFL